MTTTHRMKNISLCLIVSLLSLSACQSHQNHVDKAMKPKKQSIINSSLSGDWVLKTLYEAPLKAGISIPTLSIDTKQQRIWGDNSCNQFFTTIESLNQTTLQLGEIASTRMACSDPNIENAFNIALSAITAYHLSNQQLVFYDANNTILLVFHRRR